MDMMEEYVKVETGKLAREKGFDWDCNAIHNGPNNEEVSKLKEYEGDGTGEINNTNIDASWVDLNVYSPPIYCTAPTQSVLQKWLREEHNLSIEIKTPDRGQPWWIVEIHKVGGYGNHFNGNGEHDTYEQALETGLLAALKLIP